MAAQKCKGCKINKPLLNYRYNAKGELYKGCNQYLIRNSHVKQMIVARI